MYVCMAAMIGHVCPKQEHALSREKKDGRMYVSGIFMSRSHGRYKRNERALQYGRDYEQW